MLPPRLQPCLLVLCTLQGTRFSRAPRFLTCPRHSGMRGPQPPTAMHAPYRAFVFRCFRKKCTKFPPVCLRPVHLPPPASLAIILLLPSLATSSPQGRKGKCVLTFGDREAARSLPEWVCWKQGRGWGIRSSGTKAILSPLSRSTLEGQIFHIWGGAGGGAGKARCFYCLGRARIISFFVIRNSTFFSRHKFYPPHPFFLAPYSSLFTSLSSFTFQLSTSSIPHSYLQSFLKNE
jgi:hypothetical protein